MMLRINKIITALVMLVACFFISCKKDKASSDGGGTIINPPPSGNTDGPVKVTETAFAFPGAEGAGKNTTGGRGGRVIKVTNLNDSGTGSLRAAVEASGPRIIIFEVSGNIKLRSRLQIRNGDVTIAGQTAPGDGICLQDYETNITANNVIIRYLRFRLGDTNVKTIESDAIWGREFENVILDHCSMSWSIDEVASFYHTRNFTMQWCFITESMNNSGHEKGAHGFGGIWGGSPATFHHNLLAHHTNRNPRFDGGLRGGTGTGKFGVDRVDYRNNVVYNWSGNSTAGGENGEYNLVNNYYKYGPATPSNRRNRIVEIWRDHNLGRGYGIFHVAGNFVFENPTITADNWNGGVNFQSGSGLTRTLTERTTPFAIINIPAHTAEQAYEAVLTYGGASLTRDAIDTRIVGEVRNGTATFSGSLVEINGVTTRLPGIIDKQSDVGGWPFLTQTAVLTDTDGDGMPNSWEIARKIDHTRANANNRDLSTGYDNIEVYINSLVSTITENQYK